MRSPRLLAAVAAAGLCLLLVAACTNANPGWTYQPAPPVTPAPSVESSASVDAAFQIAVDNKDAGTHRNVAR